MYARDELFLRSLEWYFGIYSNEPKINPLVSAETVRHSSTYITLSIWKPVCDLQLPTIHTAIARSWQDRLIPSISNIQRIESPFKESSQH